MKSKIEFADMQSLYSIIASARPAASTDKEHPSLRGVCLQAETGGKAVLALATCGTWLMRLRYEPDYLDPFFKLLIPLPFVDRLLTLIGDATGHATIVRDEKIWRVTLEKLGSLEGHFGVAEVVSPAGNLPWPSTASTPMARIGLNPRLMSNLSKAFKTAVGSAPVLSYELHGEGHPVVVTCDEAPHADALLMPCALKNEEPEEEPSQPGLFEKREGASEA